MRILKVDISNNFLFHTSREADYLAGVFFQNDKIIRLACDEEVSAAVTFKIDGVNQLRRQLDAENLKS
jgi:hypothetical protein